MEGQNNLQMVCQYEIDFDVDRDRSSLKFVLGIYVVSWLALNQV